MALWGNKDLIGQDGTITINLGTEAVAGSGTTFATTGFTVSEGDILVVGAGATYGHAVISSVTSNTAISIASTQFLIPHPTTNLISGASYFVTQRPISSIEGGQYVAPDAKSNRYSTVFGVDTAEAAAASAATVGGKAGAYKVAHAGWVGVTTYVDCHGNFRVKSETLVAGSMITGDANDDTRYPDS
jgi:predicted enzyme related to lactoylglutathione lyase